MAKKLYFCLETSKNNANNDKTGFLLKKVDSDHITAMVRAIKSIETSLSAYF